MAAGKKQGVQIVFSHFFCFDLWLLAEVGLGRWPQNIVSLCPGAAPESVSTANAVLLFSSHEQWLEL